MPMQFADHARLDRWLATLGPRRFSRARNRRGAGLRCGRSGRDCLGSCCRRRRSWGGGRPLDIRGCSRRTLWGCGCCRCRLLGGLLAAICRRKAEAPWSAGTGLACKQRHCRDQDQLSHDTLRYLVNPSYLTRLPLSRRATDPDFDQGGTAGQAIDQAEQMTPHDRTPSLITVVSLRPPVFPAVFAGLGKWLRGDR
jgi:hypothetical protein